MMGDGPGTNPMKNPRTDPLNMAGMDRFHSLRVGRSSLSRTLWALLGIAVSLHAQEHLRDSEDAHGHRQELDPLSQVH